MSDRIKTSTIFVTVGRHTHIYRSPDDMPEFIREKVQKTTSGANTCTILIADRRGREELARAIRGDNASIPLRITTRARQHREELERLPGRFRARRHWLELGLVGLLGSLLYALASWQY